MTNFSHLVFKNMPLYIEDINYILWNCFKPKYNGVVGFYNHIKILSYGSDRKNILVSFNNEKYKFNSQGLSLFVESDVDVEKVDSIREFEEQFKRKGE